MSFFTFQPTDSMFIFVSQIWTNKKELWYLYFPEFCSPEHTNKVLASYLMTFTPTFSIKYLVSCNKKRDAGVIDVKACSFSSLIKGQLKYHVLLLSSDFTTFKFAWLETRIRSGKSASVLGGIAYLCEFLISCFEFIYTLKKKKICARLTWCWTSLSISSALRWWTRFIYLIKTSWVDGKAKFSLFCSTGSCTFRVSALVLQ